MAVSFGFARDRRVDLSTHEVTGAIGDSITVLPIVVSIATLTDLSLAHLLVGFAVFQVVWGLYYGIPVSVEPMKALAALVIAGGLTVPGLFLAGLLSGVCLLVIGRVGLLERIRAIVGRPVIRGVQLAVALLLLDTGIGLGLSTPWLAAGGLLVAGAVGIAGCRRASALAVVAVGLGIAALSTGPPTVSLPQPPGLPPPVHAADPTATIQAAGAQLALTLGNAAVATSLLLKEFYDADVSPDDLATSMGVMNILVVPCGGMPMCHGSGGVAGKHAFGARTAGANLVLGIMYAVAAVVAVDLVLAFPMAMLGVVLSLVALELGRAGLASDHLPLTLVIGGLGLLTSVGIAFLVGVAIWAITAVPDQEGRPTGRSNEPTAGAGDGGE